MLWLALRGYPLHRTRYTEPRYTKDIDLFVDAGTANAARVYHALAEYGAPLGGYSPADFTERYAVFPVRLS